MATPETRACLDFAFRMVVGIGVEDELYALRDGITVAMPSSIERVDLSGSGALIHLVAKAMQAHLRGVDLAQVRHDLVAADVGELLGIRSKIICRVAPLVSGSACVSGSLSTWPTITRR
jgi:hypothetical protein